MSISDTAYALVVALGVTGLTIDGVVKMLPPPQTDDFFTVQQITAERSDNTALLYVDRDIIQPIYMTPSVRVMQESENGWKEVCAAIGPTILYQTDVTLDQPVTLDWWTWGQCVEIPEGKVKIVTTWAPRNTSLEPLTYTVILDEIV